MPETGLMQPAPLERLPLPQVTLCAVSSSNLEATIRALQTCLARISFANAILFTDADLQAQGLTIHPAIRVVRIDRLDSSAAYSQFLLTHLADYVETSHCLIVQWDGHVIDPGLWRPEFLDYDYVGATWPQFDDGHDVGNGGFSLRSRRLMQACRAPGFAGGHPEDIAICRTNRALLEGKGMVFAPAYLADRFSAERAGNPASSFGYHGVFLMPRVLGVEEFWQVYRTLDERYSLRRDFGNLVKSVYGGPRPILRSLSMMGKWIADHVFGWTK